VASVSHELPTIEQAEDAAANALGRLICQGIAAHSAEPGSTGIDAVRETARDLLRGPLDEDYTRRPGGYCMRAPADPVLREIGRLGARLVELSYTVRDPARAVAEARWLFDDLGRVPVSAAASDGTPEASYGKPPVSTVICRGTPPVSTAVSPGKPPTSDGKPPVSTVVCRGTPPVGTAVSPGTPPASAGIPPASAGIPPASAAAGAVR
jgi:hypothetical protein